MLNFRLFYLMFCLCKSTLVFSQNRKIDSLLYYRIKEKSNEHKSQLDFEKAYLFYFKQDLDSTLFYTMKQLSKNKNSEIENYCHYLRGYCFKEKKLFKEAKKEFLKVKKEFAFYYKVRINLGEIALEEREYQKAIKYFEEIEKLVLTNKYDYKKSSILHNLGLCYTNLSDYDRADFYLNESRKLQEIEKDTVLLIGTYMDIAILKYTINNKKEAENYFTNAYNLSKKIKDYDLKKTASLNMSFLNELKGNTFLALEFRKEYEQWSDSVNDQNKIWEVAQLEKEFAVKQKQKEVSLLQAENKIKIAERNGLLYSAIVLLLLLGTAVYFYREKIKHNKIILLQKMELNELNATKDKLFSIVSHDLRSSVSALKKSNTKLVENLETKNFTELDKLIQKNSAIANGAYNLLDNLLNWALLQTKQIYFKKESLHLFSVIQQIEYNYKPLMLDKNISFENRVAKSIFVFADLDSLKIILRNLLDNAIKFSSENNRILIYIRASNDNLCNLVIEDSGMGMDENTRLELLKETVLLSKKKNNESVGTGLGMQLCKTMIKKNSGKLAIESKENIGTKIIVMVPKFENYG